MGRQSKAPVEASGEAAVRAAVQKALAAIAEARGAVERVGLAKLTDVERLHSNGRLRQNEPEAMRAVLDAVDSAPGTFAAIAPRDGGKDPAKVETAPARAALARYEALSPLVAAVDELLRDVGDTALAAASRAREVTIPAYAILSANASIDAQLRGAGKKALDFYGSFGLRRAQQNKRAATRAAKVVKAPPTKP